MVKMCGLGISGLKNFNEVFEHSLAAFQFVAWPDLIVSGGTPLTARRPGWCPTNRRQIEMQPIPFVRLKFSLFSLISSPKHYCIFKRLFLSINIKDFCVNNINPLWKFPVFVIKAVPSVITFYAAQ